MRLREYSPAFDEHRFAAHERFFVEDVRRWVLSRFGVALPAERTAVCGVGERRVRPGHRASAPGHLRCGVLRFARRRLPTASRDAASAAAHVSRRRHPGAVFLNNANRWADALRDAGTDVVMTERERNHGDAFWAAEFPQMIAWAFGG